MLSKVSRHILVASTIRASEKNAITAVRAFSIDQIGKRSEKPFDYKNNRYGLWNQIFDSTLKRLGENSLIITVDGNFGAGKSKFARELAKAVDFVHAREPDLDAHFYTLPNGENARQIVNEYVGDNKRFRLDSFEDWHREPTFKRGISLQHAMYIIRWMQYRTALLHLMSTGQGVVLERSAFSDQVIAQSLYEHNLLSEEAWRFYVRDLVPNTLIELWRPHVTIYLDKSPEECLRTIKQNGKPYEKESKVYTLDLLKTVDKIYNKSFLPTMRNELHVLTYQPNEVNIERVLEDLELLDFEDQTKFNDWRLRRETTINTYRRVISNYDYCMELLSSPKGFVDVPEHLWYGEEYVKLEEKLDEDSRFDRIGKSSLFEKIGSRCVQREWL